MKLTIKKRPNSITPDDLPLAGHDVQVFLDDYELTGNGLVSLDLSIRADEIVMAAIQMEAGSIAVDADVLARFLAAIQERPNDSPTVKD